MRDSVSPPCPSRDATVSEGTGLLRIGESARLGLSLPEIVECIIRDEPLSEPEVLASVRGALKRQIALTEAKIQTLKKDLEALQEPYQRLVEVCEGCNLPFSREYCDPCSHDQRPLPAVIRDLL